MTKQTSWHVSKAAGHVASLPTAIPDPDVLGESSYLLSQISSLRTHRSAGAVIQISFSISYPQIPPQKQPVQLT